MRDQGRTWTSRRVLRADRLRRPAVLPWLPVFAVWVATLSCSSAAEKDLAEPETSGSTISQPDAAAWASQPDEAAGESSEVNLVAEAKSPTVEVFRSPGDGSAAWTLENPQPSGAPLVFLVRQQRSEWLEVLLPVRPNGSSGWIRHGDVTLSHHNYRILVELDAHKITVYEGAKIFHSEPIGVGTKDTPTPGGLYYTKELIEPVDETGRYIPDGPYGPYAYGLSGFSNVLSSFAGGEGVVGIHGTNDPSALGKDVSHGCIRMSNEGITKLARTLPLGVPVEIRA